MEKWEKEIRGERLKRERVGRIEELAMGITLTIAVELSRWWLWSEVWVSEGSVVDDELSLRSTTKERNGILFSLVPKQNFTA